MENIYEKCVVKAKDYRDNLITLASVLGALGLSAASFLIAFTRPYAFAVVVITCIIAYRLVTDRNIEYEYILAANSIAMDRIYNKRRRKRVLNCDLTDFDIVAPLESTYFREHEGNVARVIAAVSGYAPENEYFGLLEYDGKRTMLIFEADERALQHMKKYIEHTLKD